MKYTCPCCGYKTLSLPSPGSFENCPVCDWEDDGYQFENPYREGGANYLSLWQAQQKFLQPKILPQYPGSWTRPPRTDELKNPDWRPLPPPTEAPIRRNSKLMENSINSSVTTFTVVLTEEQAQQLEQQAQQAGASPEEMLHQHIATWLGDAPASSPDFADAAAYVLQKNAELYRRLS